MYKIAESVRSCSKINIKKNPMNIPIKQHSLEYQTKEL